MSTSEVKEIVRSEIKKVFKEELANHLKTAMRNGDLKKDTNKLIKDALTELYKFMWVRKSVWQGEIGR
jgi:anti-sigma28 factor (negative regulator of flagellin synthesis)